MLIALYRANEDAFIRDNMNLVRAGRILNIPDREAIVAIERGGREPRWCGRRSPISRSTSAVWRQAVAAAPAAPVREREVAGRITAKPRGRRRPRSRRTS